MPGDVWFCDSAPGNAEPASLLKCGGRKSSLGLAPAPFVISAPTADPLANRALVTPGTHPTLSTDRKTRAQQLGFSSKGQFPYFDGATILKNLRMPTSNSDKFSLSCWIWPDNTDEGSIIRSPCIRNGVADSSALYIGTPGLGASFSGGITPIPGNSDSPHQRSPVAMLAMSANGTPEEHAWLYQTALGGQFGNAFYHLMIGIQQGTVNYGFGNLTVGFITVYINDTPIVSNITMDPEMTNGTGTFTIPFSKLVDGAAPAVTSPSDTVPRYTGPNEWALGAGAFRENVAGPTEEVDTALQCVVTEWWLAPGHYVDWTSSTNRNKFHTTDAVGNYIPVNLGTRGQAAGFTPAIYCTGDPGAFRINRVNGKLLDMVGGGEDVTFIPHYGDVQNLAFDDRVPGGT